MSKVESIYHKVMSFLGVELHGSEPVPGEMQTDRRYPKLFTLWFSMNFNLIAYVKTQYSIDRWF
jgi:hypothetical protein